MSLTNELIGAILGLYMAEDEKVLVNDKVNVMEGSANNNWQVRWNISESPNASSEVLEKLSKDESWGIRCNVAGNPKTSSSALERLSEDKDKYIRYLVARNSNSSSSTLERLSRDRENGVRDSAIRNVNNSRVREMMKARSASKLDIKYGNESE